MSADVLRRILIRANDDSAGPNTLFLFDEALRDERRAERERIRVALIPMDPSRNRFSAADHNYIAAILDEEAR